MVARSASARGTAAPVTTKIRSAGGATSSPASTTPHQVGEERRRRLHEGAVPLAQRRGRRGAASQTSWMTWVEPSAKLSHIP